MVEGLWRVTNLEVLTVKSFEPIRMLVYCNGIYLCVETNRFGIDFLQLLLWLNVYEVLGVLKVMKMSLDNLYQYL